MHHVVVGIFIRHERLRKVSKHQPERLVVTRRPSHARTHERGLNLSEFKLGGFVRGRAARETDDGRALPRALLRLELVGDGASRRLIEHDLPALAPERLREPIRGVTQRTPQFDAIVGIHRADESHVQ